MTLSDTETARERASGNAERSRWPALPAAPAHGAVAGGVLAGGRDILPDVLRGWRTDAAVRRLPG